MDLAEPTHITQLIAQEFERFNIRYLVGGSLASSLHGIPRATQDVDMVVEITFCIGNADVKRTFYGRISLCN